MDNKYTDDIITYDNLKKKFYSIIILTVIILNIIYFNYKIIIYFNNIYNYNKALYYKLNIYDNIYNDFYNNDLFYFIINIIIFIFILYLNYFNKLTDDNSYINKNEAYIIINIFIAIIVLYLILFIINYYIVSYNIINSSDITNIKNQIYSNIDGNFLNFMYKEYKNNNINNFGEHINDTITPILKKYNDKKIQNEEKKVINEEELINNILKIFITYRFYKFYINSKNIDDICNINNIISKDKDLFLYLTIDNDNILFPLQPKDTNIDEIIEYFKSKSDIESKYINDNYKNIKDSIIKYYNNIQNETFKNIISIKKNTNIYINYINIVYLFIAIITLIILIILYLAIFYYKKYNNINIDINCAFEDIIMRNIYPFLNFIKYIIIKIINPI